MSKYFALYRRLRQYAGTYERVNWSWNGEGFIGYNGELKHYVYIKNDLIKIYMA